MKKAFYAVALFIAVATGLLAAQPPSHPNIVLILSDDVGLGDVHCTGGPYKTPNID